jgi:hypothetical protein
MSKSSDTQNKTYGSIAALQTIVNSYPKLNLVSDILGALQTQSPMQFILNILRILGVTETEIVNWISRLLCGENIREEKEPKEKNEEARKKMKNASDGILTAIEYAIKVALFANIKDLFLGCQVEPFIPEWLLDESDYNSQVGLSVPITKIDMFDVLHRCPINENDSVFYFDCKPNIFGFTYTPSQTRCSTDFNAFLWHVINKSDSNGDIWDNRVVVRKNLLSDVNNNEWGDAATNFFNRSITPNLAKGKGFIRNESGELFDYKPILVCRYINSGAINEGGSLIKVTLPSSVYRITKKVGNETLRFPRTIFEFNYDYIFGLKLLETKTLTANIINALIGIGTEVPLDFSVDRNAIKNKVRLTIKNLIATDGDDPNSLCANSFSNSDYDYMLKSSNNYITNMGNNSSIALDATDVEKILGQVKKLEYSSSVSDDVLALLNTTNDILKEKEDVEYSTNFGFDLSFIYALIEELMVEIILQVMSPKVMMLYYINTCVMGASDDIDGWKKFGMMFTSFDDFFEKFNNLLVNIMKQIIEILLKQLMQFLIEKITPLLKIFTLQLLLETIRDYKDLIIQIITQCGLAIISFNVGKEALQLDKVDYADIVPVLEIPNNDC